MKKRTTRLRREYYDPPALELLGLLWVLGAVAMVVVLGVLVCL